MKQHLKELWYKAAFVRLKLRPVVEWNIIPKEAGTGNHVLRKDIPQPYSGWRKVVPSLSDDDDGRKKIDPKLIARWKDSIVFTPPAYEASRIYDTDNHYQKDKTKIRPSCALEDWTENFGEYIRGTEYPYYNGTQEVNYAERRKVAVPGRNVLFHEKQGRRTDLGTKISDRPQIAFSPCSEGLEFPQPRNINVNMMPFIFGDKRSLPEELQHYYEPLITKCPVQPYEVFSVMYLTIQEGFVSAQNTQRRPGLHVEAPGSILLGGNFVASEEHHWGGGFGTDDQLHGGIFVATNIPDTIAIWDALIVDTNKAGVDKWGGISHLRTFLGTGHIIPANTLVWMTDRTPHEAIIQQHDGYRQFFRLVTSKISIWYADHSTPNPNVPVPDHVKIIYGDKFSS